MPTATDIARRFYRALCEDDGDALFALLAPDFVGDVSAGMPHGVGGRHDGATAMITGVWAHIDALYDLAVRPEEYLPAGADRVVVIGRYVGAARDGSAAVDAAFAHVITTRGDRLAALRQITDTARWRLADTA